MFDRTSETEFASSNITVPAKKDTTAVPASIGEVFFVYLIGLFD